MISRIPAASKRFFIFLEIVWSAFFDRISLKYTFEAKSALQLLRGKDSVRLINLSDSEVLWQIKSLSWNWRVKQQMMPQSHCQTFLYPRGRCRSQVGCCSTAARVSYCQSIWCRAFLWKRDTVYHHDECFWRLMSAIIGTEMPRVNRATPSQIRFTYGSTLSWIVNSDS